MASRVEPFGNAADGEASFAAVIPSSAPSASNASNASNASKKSARRVSFAQESETERHERLASLHSPPIAGSQIQSQNVRQQQQQHQQQQQQHQQQQHEQHEQRRNPPNIAPDALRNNNNASFFVSARNVVSRAFGRASVHPLAREATNPIFSSQSANNRKRSVAPIRIINLQLASNSSKHIFIAVTAGVGSLIILYIVFFIVLKVILYQKYPPRDFYLKNSEKMQFPTTEVCENQFGVYFEKTSCEIFGNKKESFTCRLTEVIDKYGSGGRLDPKCFVYEALNKTDNKVALFGNDAGISVTINLTVDHTESRFAFMGVPYSFYNKTTYPLRVNDAIASSSVEPPTHGLAIFDHETFTTIVLNEDITINKQSTISYFNYGVSSLPLKDCMPIAVTMFDVSNSTFESDPPDQSKPWTLNDALPESFLACSDRIDDSVNKGTRRMQNCTYPIAYYTNSDLAVSSYTDSQNVKNVGDCFYDQELSGCFSVITGDYISPNYTDTSCLIYNVTNFTYDFGSHPNPNRTDVLNAVKCSKINGTHLATGWIKMSACNSTMTRATLNATLPAMSTHQMRLKVSFAKNEINVTEETMPITFMQIIPALGSIISLGMNIINALFPSVYKQNRRFILDLVEEHDDVEKMGEDLSKMNRLLRTLIRRRLGGAANTAANASNPSSVPQNASASSNAARPAANTRPNAGASRRIVSGDSTSAAVSPFESIPSPRTGTWAETTSPNTLQQQQQQQRQRQQQQQQSGEVGRSQGAANPNQHREQEQDNPLQALVEEDEQQDGHAQGMEEDEELQNETMVERFEDKAD